MIKLKVDAAIVMPYKRNKFALHTYIGGLNILSTECPVLANISSD